MAAPVGSQYRTTLYGGTDVTSSLTQDYQFQFNGLLFGKGTSYGVQNPQAIYGRNTRSVETLRPQDTGAFVQPDYPGSRLVTFSMVVTGSASTMQAKIEAFQTAWQSSTTGDQPLLFRLPTSNTWRLFGRPRKTDVDVRMWLKGVVSITAEFYCADPRMYDNTITTPSTATLPSSGGITFPKVLPITFGAAATSAALTATTSGTVPTPWFAKIAGPVSNPAITNGTDTIRFNGAVASGDYIIVDSMNRDVWYNGNTAASWYSHVSPSSVWWSLPASGSTTVTLLDDGRRTGDPTSTGTLAFQFRSAWL